MSEDESEVTATVSQTESKAPTVKSGTTAVEERTLSSGQEQGVSLTFSFCSTLTLLSYSNVYCIFISEKSNRSQKQDNILKPIMLLHKAISVKNFSESPSGPFSMQ